MVSLLRWRGDISRLARNRGGDLLPLEMDNNIVKSPPGGIGVRSRDALIFRSHKIDIFVSDGMPCHHVSFSWFFSLDIAIYLFKHLRLSLDERIRRETGIPWHFDSLKDLDFVIQPVRTMIKNTAPVMAGVKSKC